MSINQRIREIIEHLKISKYELAKTLEITHVTVGKWVDNQNASIRSDSLEKLISVYPEISAQWLLTGKGEMIKKPPDLPLNEQLQAVEEKNQLLKELNESLKREKFAFSRAAFCPGSFGGELVRS